MARTTRTMLAVAMLGAVAAKPPPEAAASTETTPAPPAPPDPRDAKIAELEALLVDEREASRRAIVEMRESFDASWKQREEKIVEQFRVMRESAAPLVMPDGVLPPGAPVRGKVQRFAAALIHCHAADGSKLSVRAGHAIPEDADLTGVHPSAIEER